MECPDRRGLVVWQCRCCCDGLDVLDADSEDSWLVGREGGVDDQGRNAARWWWRRWWRRRMILMRL